MHPAPRKRSSYGIAMTEKQKLKYYYGFGERMLRRFFDEARREPGNTGDALLALCERRLDNVIRRGGLAKTRPQARQGITHGHFRVNGRKVTSPAFLVRAGDVVTVKGQQNLVQFYSGLRQEAEADTEIPTWLSADEKFLRVVVSALPTHDDCSIPLNIHLVIELLSR